MAPEGRTHTHSLYSLHSLYLSTDCNVINVLGRSCLSVRLSVTLSLSCALVGWLVGWMGGWVSFVVRSFIYLSMTVHTDNLEINEVCETAVTRQKATPVSRH